HVHGDELELERRIRRGLETQLVLDLRLAVARERQVREAVVDDELPEARRLVELLEDEAPLGVELRPELVARRVDDVAPVLLDDDLRVREGEPLERDAAL